MLNCAICGKEIFTENTKKSFCRECYKQWESDIKARTEWVKLCVNYEHQQRREALRDRYSLYLGDEFDLSGCNGEYRLVPAEEYYEGRN